MSRRPVFKAEIMAMIERDQENPICKGGQAMTERPNPLTIHLSDDELAFLEMSAHRMRTLAARCDPETAPSSMLNMTPALMAVMLIEMCHSQFLEDEKVTHERH